MKYQCLILDDEPLARIIIREYLHQVPDFAIVAECDDAAGAQTIMLENQIDLLFLDIALPGISGMEFLRTLTKPPLVIFTTAYSEYAVEAFEVNAFDYLVKPVSLLRFLSAIDKVRVFLKGTKKDKTDSHTWINIRESRRIHHLYTSEILYLQAYGDYVRVFTKGQTIMTKDKLSAIKENLPAIFVQVHRSFIVNPEVIKFLEGNMLIVGDVKIPVSDSYREELIRILQ